MNLRFCASCHQDLPEENFATAGGKLRERCRACTVSRRARKSGESLESHLKRAASVVKHRAKKQGIPFNLSGEILLSIWKEQDGRCAMSGAPLTHHRRNETGSIKRLLYSPTNVSIDRINPDGPYVRENIMLVCAAVNVMRRNMQVDEFVMWCRMISDNDRETWG